MPEDTNTRGEAWLLGLGLDNQDGHTRITRGEQFFLLGGSRQTHEQMQEKVIRFNEELDKHGKRLEEVSPDELRQIARDAGMVNSD